MALTKCGLVLNCNNYGLQGQLQSKNTLMIFCSTLYHQAMISQKVLAQSKPSLAARPYPITITIPTIAICGMY